MILRRAVWRISVAWRWLGGRVAFFNAGFPDCRVHYGSRRCHPISSGDCELFGDCEFFGWVRNLENQIVGGVMR